MSNVVKRWWRGRGHGVHSPFAFRFITEVLHCGRGYGYYADEELRRLWESAPKSGRMSLRELRAIYRVGVAAGSGAMYCAPTLGADARAVRPYGDDASGLVAAALRMADARAVRPYGGGAITVWGDVRRGGWCEAVAEMRHGMSFTDGRIGVIVDDERLPLQHFEIMI